MKFIGIFFCIAFILEIVSIVLMGKLIGGWTTFALMILAAMFGVFLLRNNLNIAKVLMAGGILKNGTVSFYELFLPIRVPVAGLLFIMPGFLSDVAAWLLLLPFAFGKSVAKSSDEDAHTQYRARPNAHNDDVIEGDFVVRDEPAKKKNIDVIEHRP